MQVLCLEDVFKGHCCLRKTFFLPEYGKFDSEWFSRVVWSDESRFQLHADAPERCVRRSGEKYNSECISTTVKHGFNALENRIILQKGLLPTIEKLFSEEMLFFNKTMLLPTLQRPKTKKTKKSIRLMFWPGPDLNPLENIWSHIKLQVYPQGLNI